MKCRSGVSKYYMKYNCRKSLLHISVKYKCIESLYVLLETYEVFIGEMNVKGYHARISYGREASVNEGIISNGLTYANKAAAGPVGKVRDDRPYGVLTVGIGMRRNDT